MNRYFVTWEIKVDADNPREAAEEALKIQRDPQSSATVFRVTDEAGTVFTIDLEDDEEGELQMMQVLGDITREG